MGNNSLKGFELNFEEFEENKVSNLSSAKPKKPVKTAKSEVKKESFKSKVNVKLTGVKTFVKKLKPSKKKTKKLTKEQKTLARQQKKRGILGIGLLFVVVSIAYSSYVIYNGVNSTASRVMLVPQVVFAVFTLFKAFSKIYK